MILLKGLLINLLFILLLVLFFSMILWNKQKLLKIEYQGLVLSLLCSALICVSLFFSIPVNENFIYDLRFIPFLLGSIYGGKRVTIILGIVLILVRLPFGGDGIWLTISLVVVSSLAILWLNPKFGKKTTNWRLCITTTFSFIYSIFGFLVPSFYYEFNNIITFCIYSVVLTSSTFFVTYLTEVLRTTYILQLGAIKNEKMEIVSHLAASISHEVRNPLTSVKGFLQLILEHRDIPDNCHQYASLALDETVRASDIINDYLTFAKPHPEVLVMLDIEKEILKCKEIIGPLALKNSVNMNMVFFHTTMIQGDPHKFRQVLLNICKNAIEAMPKGGTLSIVTTTNDNKTVVHIADTGHGMSPEHVARLGEPYFSLKEQKGTGLGMMVVFRIVEGMGGNVKVSSEEQFGTSITLSFPNAG